MSEEIPSVHRHRQSAPRHLAVGVVTVSDTRTLEDDTGGALVVELLEAAGHRVVGREIVHDEAGKIRSAVEKLLPHAQAVILTGGTGVAPRDVTPEAITPLFDRTLPGFGELFRALSYEEIGAAAMLSRATAGLIGERVIFALPGSRGAIRTALEKLILPELGHLVGEGSKH
ncbi:MAG: MogA/MoaB family molybdenum cofactor biosynthesis protein [bacterium]|nr:MogA/MoaB family molybdenum cofactor biosynthesis protein [bacterium]MCP5071490.1 MogA/MoaB family molybdenum cofactor biosynthesis protein [bacterium]